LRRNGYQKKSLSFKEMKFRFADIKKMSLRTRIILIYTALTILLVGTISYISYTTVRGIYLNQLSDRVEVVIRMIGSRIHQNYLDFLEPGMSNSIAATYYKNELTRISREIQIDQIFIFNREFETLVSPEKSPTDAALLLSRSELLALESNQTLTTLPFKGNDGSWYLWGFYRFSRDYFIGIRENASRLAEVDRLSIIFWGIGLLGLLLTVLSGWYLARSLANPIEKLVSFSKELGKGNFFTRLPDKVHGELSVLAHALDRMSQDLNNHHQEKERMLAQIAHEIRNPLGGIELLAGLIKEDLENSNQNPEYVNKILREVSGLKQLVTAYLNFSRPAPAKPETVSIPDLLKSVMPYIQNKLDQKSIHFFSKIEYDQITFDPDQLKQILINLFHNSIEAVEERGQIIFRSENKKNNTVLEIVDDGSGIEEKHFFSLFQPFFSTRTNGTGLGLAICKKLCIENQAEIIAKNNPKSGCTFTIIKQN
jgi:signal transduction histidine kinase